MLFRTVTTWIFLFSALPSAAPTPPETNQLGVIQDTNYIDPILKEWFDQYHGDRLSPADLPRVRQEKFLKGQSPASSLLFRLKFHSFRQNKEDRKQDVLTFINETKLALEESQKRIDPIVPYVLFEISSLDLLDRDQTSLVAHLLLNIPGASCPKKEQLLMAISHEQENPANTKEIESYLSNIQTFKSENFRENALEALLDAYSEQDLQPLRHRLSEIIAPFPELLSDNLWIASQSTTPEIVPNKNMKFLDTAIRESNRKRCNTARSLFLKGITNIPPDYLKEVERISSRISQCFRRKGTASRLRFWRSIKSALAKAFGFPGEALSLKNQGLIYWGIDRFDQAKQIFSDLLTKSEIHQSDEIKAQITYTLGRILENEGQIQEAIALYRKLIHQYPESDHVEASSISLVLLNTIRNQPQEALKFVHQIITSENLKKVKERSAKSLSFALFWAGRLYYQIGEKEKALEYWRRVSSEFYSTFYGALGHFVLEKKSGKLLQLQPTLNGPFNENKLLSGFNQAERQTVDLVKNLLKLGLKEEAICELSEISYEAHEYPKMVIKSMYLYAAGDWLEAIKIFGNIPRTYRHSLSTGMERILFPKTYQDLIEKYTQKLGVDADYIYSIIRQESVFNPRARSPVGATGLMQLMPRTARNEARYLTRSYLTKKHRLDILKMSKRRKNLYNAEVNLVLGIHHVHRLMQKYQNPIFVLTAYNASPKATEKWMNNIGHDDFLSFIERIPYRETKSYVKLVLRNYFYYKKWYGKSDMKLPHIEFLEPLVLAKNKSHSR